MDWIGVRGRLTDFVKKYRYAVLVVLIGLVLMCLPSKKETEQNVTVQPVDMTVSQPTLSDSLAAILSQIKGAGKVKVLLTEAYGTETLYQMDEDMDEGADSNSVRRETVLISGADRIENGLVRQVNPPGYLGAVVVCEGADNAGVQLAIVEAVRSVTGLGADHITVLKMK